MAAELPPRRAGTGAPIIDANFNDPIYAKAHGDTNGDRRCDGTDFLIWQRWYFYPPAPEDVYPNGLVRNYPPELVDYDGDGVITPEEVQRLFEEYFGEDWGG